MLRCIYTLPYSCLQCGQNKCVGFYVSSKFHLYIYEYRAVVSRAV